MQEKLKEGYCFSCWCSELHRVKVSLSVSVKQVLELQTSDSTIGFK